MKKVLFTVLAIIGIKFFAIAQSPGDTIIVSAFNYTQTYGVGIRDTIINFPNLTGVNYRKIYMLYNMRCKNGVVGNLVTPTGLNGCGEWDYSCNTYITDSSKVDSTKTIGPSHVISGFTGTTYNYTTNPTYTYFKYVQQQVSNTSTISESTATLGSGNSTTNLALHTQLKNGKSYFVWTASELLAAGLVAGNISSIRLNVLNAGSNANFFRIQMKHTSQASLNNTTPDVVGFNEVYSLNTVFTNGSNQLNFYNNFNWNGTDNILVELSFSNSTSGTDNILLSDINPTTIGLVTNSNDYSFEFDGSNHIAMGNGNFSTIANQVSISFWANGNSDFLPSNTSVLEATGGAGLRQINIHFPWSNSNIFWDCGKESGYDRINLLATQAEFEGNWNHWTFTKNVTTGIMNIYKNGILWHTASGKTIPIEVTNMVLGMNYGGNNKYYGKIDELSIWNSELTQTDIQTWMNKTITSSHPNYSNLVAYYPFNEGSGAVCNDNSATPSNSTVNGNQLWSNFKGKDIFKNFEETNNRPQVTFVQGTYVQNTITTTLYDSVLNNMNTVKAYNVINNDYVLASTNSYYKAGYTYVYDAISNAKIDSVLIPTQNTINITDLIYMVKSPARFQIMSFVTPYGNGLNLGVNGKTWTFDITDLAPILKGNKRMTMDAGGQWQEDMDIKFMFIVGTPPQNILDINNLWKVESTSYTNILNDNKYEPRNVLMNPAASSYKIRTAITGHGQEGEFIPRTHQINVNGGTPEFSWDVWKRCGENPVYPQGGTWIYDRAGWCPGMATDLKEMNITNLVTPGSTAQIDYHLTTASGTSNYWVSNQLVEYSAANFTLDASVIEIKNPTNKVEYARTNPFCGKPSVVIQNTGSTTLTSLKIDYWVNGNTVKETYQWTGSLAFLETAEIELPTSANLWSSLIGTTENSFNVEVKEPNSQTDGNLLNNKFSSIFNVTNVLPRDFIVWVRTNTQGSETSYKIVDEHNNVFLSRSGLSNSTDYRDTLALGYGCYSLIIDDAGEDGLSFWANSAGSGFARLRRTNGVTITNLQADFGTSIVYNFTIDYPLNYDEIFKENSIKLYPNPAKNQFILEGKNMLTSSVRVYNNLGQIIEIPAKKESSKIVFDSSNLKTGMYYIVLNDAQFNTQTLKLNIE